MGCGIALLPHYKRCSPCNKLYQVKRVTKNQKANLAAGLCRCGNTPIAGRMRCKGCTSLGRATSKKYVAEKKNRPYLKAYREKMRNDALEAYGGVCSCCGEWRTEFLQFDHVGGWGHKHLAEKGYRYHGVGLYIWMRDNFYPASIRILCGSCHSAISFYGYCPHEKERETEAAANLAVQ